MDLVTSLLALVVLYRCAFGPSLFEPLSPNSRLPVGVSWSWGHKWARVRGSRVVTGREWNVNLQIPVLVWRLTSVVYGCVLWQLVCARVTLTSAPYWVQLRFRVGAIPLRELAQ